jgi:acyl-CoA thioester hydrolase
VTLENRALPEILLDGFPLRSTDKLRYGDTDRQGHVNNAVFSTFLETGRVAALYDLQAPLAEPGCTFVIARLTIDFLAEILWPGDVQVGTRVASVGRSSMHMEQAIFQNGKCVATSQSVIVQMDEASRKSRPLSAGCVAQLEAWH